MNYYVVEIRYALTLDALRAKARASFSGPEDKRRISRNTSMTDKKCFTEHFRMSASDFVPSLAHIHTGDNSSSSCLCIDNTRRGFTSRTALTLVFFVCLKVFWDTITFIKISHIVHILEVER